MDRPNDSDDDDDDEMMEDVQQPFETSSNNNNNAFLDSFYGLTATDAPTRAAASQVLLQHALAHPADAAYCLKRLLNGLCSGRTAARQGNAACLAAFLQRCPLQDLRREELSSSTTTTTTTTGLETTSDAAYIAHRLREATEPKEGKKKGSEERDYQFGRLFGINAVVRSGLLWRDDDEEDVDTIHAVVRDLIGLYRQKRWLREPVAHAICTLLQALYNQSTTKTLEFAKAVVEETVVPELLVNGDMAGRDALTEGEEEAARSSNNPLSQYSAEQIALSWFLRATTTGTSTNSFATSPSPLLREPNLSSSIPHLAQSLSETSNVVQPRTHLVWDALFLLVTKPTRTSTTSSKVHTRRNDTDDNDDDENNNDLLLPSIWQSVVVDRLVSTTHEKRALALCLLRNVSGVEFVSSLTGRTRLCMDATLVQLWTHDTVQKLLLDILCGSKSSLLQPLALSILEQVVSAFTQEEPDARWTIARALLECEPRFDTRTKTKTVEKILRLKETNDLQERYFSFLEEKILNTASAANAEDNAHKTPGYMDLLFHSTKTMSRVSDGDSTPETSPRFLRSATIFFGMAFLDCSSLESKSKGKQEAVGKILARLGKSSYPFSQRSVASARFYSLISDEVASILYTTTTDKETALLKFMTDIQTLQQQCLDQDAKLLQEAPASGDDKDNNAPSILRFLHSRATTAQKSKTMSTAERKWTECCTTLAVTLHLHLLSCSAPELDETERQDGDHPDENDDDDEEKEEILHSLVGIKEIYTILVDKTEESAASFLVEICVNLLASPLGAGHHSRGASPTLLREVVKRFWINGLTFCAQQKLQFDKEAMSMLLQGIGIEPDESMEITEEEADDDDEDMSEEEINESDDSSEASETKIEDLAEGDPSKEEIQIDNEKLQEMMLEDDDADIDETVLEHHDGADAALAKFIQMKQDARKAGQLARERIALASQMRCIVFLETIAVGKPETWGGLLTMDIVLYAVIETLRLRLSMLKSLEKASGAVAGDKRSFIDRISTVLKSKLLKAKVPSWTSTPECRDAASRLAEKVMKLARSSGDKDHQALCATAMLFCIRHVEPATAASEIAESMLGPAVEEWATKRTTKIDSSLLDTLIHQGPVVSQASLLPALIKATTAARSSYLKSESLRLVAALLNPKLNAGTTEMEKTAKDIVLQSIQPAVEALTASLVDTEMKKTKRLREVLKTGDKLVGTVLSLERIPTASWEGLLRELASLKSSTESSSITKTLDKMTAEVETIIEKLAQPDDESNKRKSPTAQLEEEEDDVPAGNQTKKTKKKGKKKKKGKR